MSPLNRWRPVGHSYRNTRRFLMNNYTHKTAPTQFVEAAGIRFAYRRFGAKVDIPLLFFMHFTGTMDHWDPAVTDRFAQDREVILFNNAGVSSSSGEVPTRLKRWRSTPRPSSTRSALRSSTLSDFRSAASRSSSPWTGQTLSEDSSWLALAQRVAEGWHRQAPRHEGS